MRSIQAAPLVGWELPEEFTELRRLLEARLSKRGKREYVQVLRLLGDLLDGGGHQSGGRCTAAESDLLRCGETSFTVPGSSNGRRGWICRTIRTCRWHRWPPRRPPTTWRC